MSGSNENPRQYKWPWLVAGAVILGIVLAVIWVSIAVKKVERERDVYGPIPSSAPAH